MDVSSSKRVKLEISQQKKEVVFTLSNLMLGEILVRETVQLGSDKIREKGEEWESTLNACENKFWSTYKRGLDDLLPKVRESNITSEDQVRRFVLSHPTWKTIIDNASETLMTDVGRFVYDFSDDLLQEFLPGKSTHFAELFNKVIDHPTVEASRNGDPDSWLRIPLLQIKVDPPLLCVPWWIARTYDENSLWSCRYAIAVSTGLGETQPPAIKIDGDKAVNILSITRPTFDLEHSSSISTETISTAYPFIEKGKFSWRLLDGVLGDHFLAGNDQSIFNNDGLLPSNFEGISKREVRKALNNPAATPNIIFYQGHWYNYQFDNTVDPPPYIFLDNGRRTHYTTTENETLPLIPSLHLPVPLLSVLPPNPGNKILIMHGCHSGFPAHQSEYIAHYISNHSAFIGSNYPFLSNPYGLSSDIMLRSFLKNQFLAHSVLEVNRLDQQLSDEHCDVRELYKKAALCLFGDVRTNIYKEYRTKDKDNLSRLTLKLTDRWDAGLKRLGLRDHEGMTFLTETTDLSPTGKFALNDDGVQMALAPLVVAIDLCIHSPGSYVVLGPAFSSRESVALISKTLKHWDEFRAALKRRIEAKGTLRLGILANRLTSTYLVQLKLTSILSKWYNAEQISEIMRSNITTRTALWRGEGNSNTLLSSEFLNTVDLSLSLNSSTEELEALGLTVLENDLETQATQLLGMKVDVLPRGVLITRRKFLESDEGRPPIVEFCNSFNESVKRMTDEGREGMVINDIPLATYDNASPNQLLAIRRFAQTEFFSNHSFGWENFSHQPRTVLSSTEARNLVATLESVPWSGGGVLSAQLEGEAVAKTHKDLVGSIMTSISGKPEWQMTSLHEKLKAAIRDSRLPGRIKDVLHGCVETQIGKFENEVIGVE